MDRPKGFRITLREIMVGLAVLVVLVVMAIAALPTITTGCIGPRLLWNMKQLHWATQQMALDAVRTGDTNIGWPGDLGGFTRWATNLVGGGYLSTNDFCKLMAGPEDRDAGVLTKIWRSAWSHPPPWPAANTNAVLVYAVYESAAVSDGNTVFLSSGNFTNTPGGGVFNPAANPFGNAKLSTNYFIVFHKAGDGLMLMSKQVGNTNLVGGFAPLCR